MTPQDLTTEARSWLGVPFRHQGRDRDGVDCVGFVAAIAIPAGLAPPSIDRRDYGRLPSSREIETRLARYLVKVDQAAEGDVIVIRWRSAQEASHVAYCAGATLIQAYGRSERVVECGYREPWRRMTAAVYRFPAFLGVIRE
jgi:cell wall-associated NlpC family hydrolase